MSDAPPKVRFEYIKSSLFRVIHSDGAFGGMTPRGDLLITFYSERFPIPTATMHEIGPSGELGQELRSERETRKGILREVEVAIQFDLDVVKNFASWLQEKIPEAEKQKSALQAKSAEQVQ